MPNKLKPIFALTLVSAIWGVATPVIKYTVDYIPVISFLYIRFLLAAFILYFFVDFKKGYLKNLGKKGFFYAFLLGALGSSINLGLYFLGVKLTSSIEATFIYSSAPIFSLFAGVIFLKEKLQKNEVIGLVIILFGFLLTLLKPLINTTGEQGTLLGNFIVLVAVLAWVAYSVLSRFVFNGVHSEEKFSPVFITFLTAFAGAITLFPFASVELLTTQINFEKAFFGIMYMTVASSVIAYWLFEYGIKKLEVSEASLFQYAQPIFTIPIAIIFLGEQFSVIYLIGAAFVVVGLVIAQHHPLSNK